VQPASTSASAAMHVECKSILRMHGCSGQEGITAPADNGTGSCYADGCLSGERSIAKRGSWKCDSPGSGPLGADNER
jgi:hypothetical protein